MRMRFHSALALIALMTFPYEAESIRLGSIDGNDDSAPAMLGETSQEADELAQFDFSKMFGRKKAK